MRDILQSLADGLVSVDEAQRRLNIYAVHEMESVANLDIGRVARLGKPEIIRCAGKSVEQAISLALPFLNEQGVVALSGATQEHWDSLSAERADAGIRFEAAAGILIARSPDAPVPERIGKAAIMTAGTSDLPVAMQTQLIAEMLGVETMLRADIGISGLHRLFPALSDIIEWDPDAIVLIAGQEGGLAPVVAGLVDLPIIAVPTSTGTGFGGQGIAALSTMLQSCALGLAVVNIDNGIAAGVMAATIARRVQRGGSGT